MSTIEITSKIEALKELEALIEEAKAEAETLRDAGDVLLFEEGLKPDALRRFTDAVMHACGGRCAVFAGSESSYKYAVGQVDGDLRALVKDMNAALSGRGGGKPFFAQGSVNANEAAIRDFFSKI